MRRSLAVLAAALVGAVAGASLMLALPSPGLQTERTPPPDPVVGEVEVRTLLAWTPGRLPDGYAGAVRDLPDVRRAAEVRSGVAWLDAWRDRDGARRTPRRGYRVPVEVAAVDPRGYTPFVPPGDREILRRLGPGRALMGRTGAELRGVGPGGVLRFRGTTLRVEGVLDDELVGAHEVLVSTAVGERLGITRPRYLLVAPARDAPRKGIERAIRAPLPKGTRVRVRGPGETPFFRHGDAVLAPVMLKRHFGEFAATPGSGGTLRIDPRWVEANIRTARMPILGEVRCHRLLLPLLRGALDELTRRGLGSLVDPGDYGGCFSPRFLNRSPEAGISHHAWGIAADLNVTGNPFGAEPRMDARIVEVMEEWGFTWGGRWLVPDGMHFEFLRYPDGG